MIVHPGAFAHAVHRPHRAADVDAADTELGRGDRPDGAAARQVAAVRVALVRHFGVLAPADELRGGDAFGAVTPVGVGFDHRPLIDVHAVIGVVRCRKVRMIAVRHVGADQEAVRQRPGGVFAIHPGGDANPLQSIGEEAAAGADMTLAADFLVIEKRAHQRAVRIIHDSVGQQCLQAGVARRQIVDLAVGVELPVRTPHRAFLGVIHRQIPRQDLRRGNAAGLLQQRQKIRLRQLLAGQLREQRRQFVLLVQFQTILVDAAVHVNRQVRQTQQRLIKAHQPVRQLAVLVEIADTARQAQVAVGECRQDRPAVNFDAEPGKAAAHRGGVRTDAESRRIGMRADDFETRFNRRFTAQYEQHNRRIVAHHVIAPAGLQLPFGGFIESGKLKGLHRGFNRSGGMPRTRAAINEIE